MDYRIIKDSLLWGMELLVREKLREGYKLAGGPFVGPGGIWCQAVYKV